MSLREQVCLACVFDVCLVWCLSLCLRGRGGARDTRTPIFTHMHTRVHTHTHSHLLSHSSCASTSKQDRHAGRDARTAAACSKHTQTNTHTEGSRPGLEATKTDLLAESWAERTTSLGGERVGGGTQSQSKLATEALFKPYGTLQRVMRHIKPSKLITQRRRLRGEALEPIETDSCLLSTEADAMRPPISNGKLVGRRSARFLTGQGHVLRQRGDSDSLQTSLSVLKQAVKLGMPAGSSPSDLDREYHTSARIPSQRGSGRRVGGIDAAKRREGEEVGAAGGCSTGTRPLSHTQTRHLRPQSAQAHLEESRQKGSQHGTDQSRHWYNSLTELGSALESVGRPVAASQIFLTASATAPTFVAASRKGRATVEDKNSAERQKQSALGVKGLGKAAAGGGQRLTGGEQSQEGRSAAESGGSRPAVGRTGVEGGRQLRVSACFRSSNCLFKAGKYEEALQVMDGVLREHESNVSALRNKALAYRRTGDFRSAIDMYQKVRRNPPFLRKADSKFRKLSGRLPILCVCLLRLRVARVLLLL